MRPGEIEIELVERQTGKHHSRALRRKQLIPAVIYGQGVEGTTSAAIDEKSVLKYGGHKFENTIFSVKSTNPKLSPLKVLMKEVTRHPLSRKALHVDMYAVDMKKPVRVPVELRYEGKAAGLAEGGVLQSLLRELMVECLPALIPEFIPVDVTNLNIHESLHINDLKLPDGVKAVSAENLALVTVTVIKDEVLTAAPAADAAAAVPEVIGKGKKPEEGAAAPAAGGAAPAAGAKAPAAKTDKK